MLPRAIPKRNVARISANELRVVPMGKTKTRVHNISLAREAIPEYINIKRRSSDNSRFGMIELVVSLFDLMVRVFVDLLLVKNFLNGTHNKKTRMFIAIAVKFVPLTPKNLTPNVWAYRQPTTAPNVFRL